MLKHATRITMKASQHRRISFDKLPFGIQEQMSGYIKSAVDKIYTSKPEPPPLPDLVQLHTAGAKSATKKSECTLYVKGFLGARSSSSIEAIASLLNRTKTEQMATTPTPTLKTPEEQMKDEPIPDAEAFALWKKSHDILVQKPSHDWAPECFAWNWPSGKLPQQFKTKDPDSFLAFMPIPIATMALAAGRIVYSLIRYKSKNPLLMLTSPAFLASGLLQDVALAVVLTYYEYNTAKQNASTYAEKLCSTLIDLRKEYDFVRVVAHSLGCMHVIEGIDMLNYETKPDEVHLCGAAVVENVYAEKLQKGIARQVYHYYATQDYLLSYIMPTITLGQHAIGANPLIGKYPNMSSYCVDEHFDFFVHNTYAQNFHKFAQPGIKAIAY